MEEDHICLKSGIRLMYRKEAVMFLLSSTNNAHTKMYLSEREIQWASQVAQHNSSTAMETFLKDIPYWGHIKQQFASLPLNLCSSKFHLAEILKYFIFY